MRWCDGFLKNLRDLVEVDTHIGRDEGHLKQTYWLDAVSLMVVTRITGMPGSTGPDAESVFGAG